MGIAFLPNLETYGREVRMREFAGFAVSVGAHRPGETIPAHRHADEYVWCLVLDGALEESSGARREEASAGSLLVRPPDCVHADRFAATPGLCLNLFPNRDWLVANKLDAIGNVYSHQRAAALLSIGRDIACEIDQSDTRASLAIESLLIELLSRAARLDDYERCGRPRWLAWALDEIEANPAGELRLSELAQHCGVSAGHLARAFRAAFGKSLGEYVRERRLERAAAMIRSVHRPLAEIATAVGFYDQAHFSRAFKARFKLSPAAYGRALRTNN